MTTRCLETGLSVSYAYKKGCRCAACRQNKAVYTKRDKNAGQRAKIWWKKNPNKKKCISTYNKRYRDKKWLTKFKQLVPNGEAICQICCNDISVKHVSNGRLHIDHCHKTGKLRGVLCGNCNVGLGHFRDNVKLLKNAIKYLKKNGA